jgi:type II secretory pathway pseudopilin PulG
MIIAQLIKNEVIKMKKLKKEKDERGMALVVAIIILAILSVVSLTALAFSASEARIAGSELQRMQTFYAASAGIEKMTNDFSNLFRIKMFPTATDLYAIEHTYPTEMTAEGFTYDQHLVEDTDKLARLRALQGIPNTIYPRVNIPEGPYAGLFAAVIPYKMTSTAFFGYTGTQVKLEREFNNYLVPLFQFGVFSNEDLEFHPGPFMTFNGRIHSNANIYALRNSKFLSRLTMAGELIRDARRDGTANTTSGNTNVWVEVNGINVQMQKGSMQSGSGTPGGPYIAGSSLGMRGYYPTSPQGIPNTNWETTSVLPAVSGVPNQYGGQVLTNTTGANELKLPLELEGNSPAEIIKRGLPTDSTIMQASRYQNKATVRILIDDETAGSGASNVAGIPAGKGVLLSTFEPTQLGAGGSLKRVNELGTDGTTIKQRLGDNSLVDATYVRTVKSKLVSDVNSAKPYPGGSGITGKILIEIVKPDGTTLDVTQEILSMGVTEGEPNGIVYLQRPLWMSYIQATRDRSGGDATMFNLVNTPSAVDGETLATPTFDTSRSFISNSITSLDDDSVANGGTGTIIRENSVDILTHPFNQIVPINIYNVREGWYKSTMDYTQIYERGITNTVELNMKNLARWFDGVYDSNLLSGTNAVSTNIKGDEGYVVYFSDRRGDKPKDEKTSSGVTYHSTNGIVDNEDIYGPNNVLDDGEDVIDFGWDSTLNAPKKGTLQRDLSELPEPGGVWSIVTNRIDRSRSIMGWTNGNNYFRRSLKLFNGENLTTTGATGKLSNTKGISIASENIVYIVGNYNTTGVASIPVGYSTLNDGGYLGPQVPASIVSDAFFPLSKTWFDALTSVYPEGSSNASYQTGDAYRMADENVPSVSQNTAVRAGIIAGTTLSAMQHIPGRNATGKKESGGTINFPRFLEIWNIDGITNPWSYTGSFVPLYHSTQAIAPWENDTAVIYMPPRRNWSFDITFRNPSQIPPGTPFFQYVGSTGFRQKIRE